MHLSLLHLSPLPTSSPSCHSYATPVSSCCPCRVYYSKMTMSISIIIVIIIIMIYTIHSAWGSNATRLPQAKAKKFRTLKLFNCLEHGEGQKKTLAGIDRLYQLAARSKQLTKGFSFSRICYKPTHRTTHPGVSQPWESPSSMQVYCAPNSSVNRKHGHSRLGRVKH